MPGRSIHMLFFFISLLLLPLGILAYRRVYWSDYHPYDIAPFHHDTHGDDEDIISVIIPALNEGTTLSATINRLFLMAADGEKMPTVVVVHAGSDVNMNPLIAAHPTLHVVPYPGRPSRGSQLNFGAAYAVRVCPRTSVFLFLHADTLLPPSWDTVIRTTIVPSSSSPHPPALGSFTLSLPPPISRSLRLMLWGANHRARWGSMPYGDQGYFVTRRVFDAIGGFPSVPIMEDVELLRRVARIGQVFVVDEPVETSVRRWKQKGVFWNTMLNQILILAWMCGVSHETIYQVYYGQRKKERQGVDGS